MAADHKTLLNDIATYVAANVTAPTGMSFKYTGIMPSIRNQKSYENFPLHKFPCLGPAMNKIRYSDKSINAFYPVMVVDLVFSNRNPSHDPTEVMSDLMEMTEEIQDLVASEADGNYFGQSSKIDHLEMIEISTMPTFYTNIKGNKKAFNIAYLQMELSLSQSV